MDKQKTLVEGDVSKEQLSKELEAVSSEILKRQEIEKIQTLTNPSAIALSTTKHDAGSNINKVKRNVRELFILYLTNQFVARAINVRADALISRGYTINGEGKGVKMCEDLINNSGGINLFWQLSVNSVTKDTPIIVKYPDSSIDIIEMSELYKDDNDTSNIGRYSTQEIRDLQVMTDDGWQNIKYVFKHKVSEDIYKVRTGTGLAKVTHDHSLISHGEEIHSKELQIGTNIDVVDIIDESLVNNYKDISNDIAWLYGFFVSDGTAGIYKTGKQWKISNKNKEFLEKALLIIRENYDKTAKIYWYNDIGHVAFSPVKNNELFTWYLANCYTPNRFKRVPQQILNSSKHVMTSFMEGYWAGDGAKFTTWKNSRYATDSFTLIAGIEYIVKSLGKSISLNSVKNRENVYLIQIRDGVDDKPCFENLENLNYIMESEHGKKEALSDDEISILTDIPRRTITHYRSLNNVPSKYQRQEVYDTENTIFGFYDDNHFDYLTKRKRDGIVDEIRTEFYNDYVYDIATENHKFVAGVGGLLHHNTDIAGDGFLEKLSSKNKKKLLRLKHVHPLTLEFKKNDITGKIILNSSKEPKGYVQIFLDDNGVETSKDIAKEKIEHLRYNTLGDEFTGISTIQPGYDTIVRLMNMEYSAAEAAVKIANPIIVGECNTKSPHQIAQWGQILGRINGRDQVFIPQDMKLDTLSPGSQNFNEYAEYFLNAVVACYDKETEILTNDGWKLFKNLDKKDLVAQVDQKTFKIEYVKPTKYIQYKRNGKMYHFKNKFLDVMVTPDHQMLFSDDNILQQKRQVKFEKKEAQYIDNRKIHIPQAASYDGEKIDFLEFESTKIGTGTKDKQTKYNNTTRKFKIEGDVFCEFMGFYLGDGWCSTSNNQIHLVASEVYPENIKQIEKLLNKMGVNWYCRTKEANACIQGKMVNIHGNMLDYHFSNVAFNEYLRQFGKAYDKYVPDVIKKSTTSQRDLFLKNYLLTDGSGKSIDGFHSFGSMSEKLIDDVQEICVKKKRATTKYHNSNGCFELYVRANKFNDEEYRYFAGINKTDIKQIDYNDNVYCVTVPSGVIVTRRGGRVAVCGNCFGVPKSILLGESGSGGGSNRAEQVVLSRHFYSLIRSNQRYMEEFFNKIFEEYGELSGFKPPKLEFEDVAENAEANSQSAMELYQSDIIDRNEARAMIGLYPTKLKKIGKDLNKELKDSDKKTNYPAEPGSKEGSQKNVKKKQKQSDFSETK